jgi:hypothetical protein
MTSLESAGKLLLIIGGFIAAAGLLLLLFGRLGLGRLPGDILIRRENFVFYFPVVTTLLISVLLTLLINLIRRLL